ATSVESAFVAKVNALRASKGLGSLRVDGELTAIGRRWAASMAGAGDISHNPRFQHQVQADWVKLGENVGMGPEVDKLFRAFVASPTHYKNLVDGAFTRIGVGVVLTDDGMIFTSHQFERLAADDAVVRTAAVAEPERAPAAAPAAAAPAPRPVAAPAPVPASPRVPAHAVQVLEQLRLFDRPAA
ncbi:MAG TPA: CAP domain-containing protein, partial [Acidimicrobiales bacterium]